MTPLVTIGMPLWNGEAFVSQTIASILSQDYQNIELIILDNQSTDESPSICREFAKNDSRVRYIVDDEKKDVMEAHRKIVQYARGDFFMVACDDDWYDPGYIGSLVKLLITNSEIGLAYSGWGYISSDGIKKPIDWKHFFTASNSRYYNFMYYLFFRIPLPIVFGIMRTEVHKDALKYFYRPDNRGWNHDNLYMLRLLSMVKVDSTKDILFYYRQRDRFALYRARGQYDLPEEALYNYLNSIQHQISVTKAVAKIINASHFSVTRKNILNVYNYIVLLYYCRPRYLFSNPVISRLIRTNPLLRKLIGK